MEREKQFKNRGNNADELKARRVEVQVGLRKEKREEHLAKRRHFTDVSESVTGHDGINDDIVGMSRPDMVTAVLGNDENAMLSGVIAVRKSLSRRHNANEVVEFVISSGLLPRLVQCLGAYGNPVLQYEAAWAVTNIASGTTEHTRMVVEAGAVPHLVQLATSSNLDASEQAVWALGNISGEGAAFRDVILNSGGLPPILHLLTNCPRVDIVRTATWTLANLCRGKNPPADFQKIKTGLPVLARLIWAEDDEEIVQSAVTALSYVSDGGGERIQALIDAGVCRRLCDLLIKSKSENTVFFTLRVLINITSGSQYETQVWLVNDEDSKADPMVVINSGALPNLLHLLSTTSEKIRKQTCFVLSNITAGTQEQLQSVINIGLIEPLIDCMQGGELVVRKEACWAITNALRVTDQQAIAICSPSVIAGLCNMLSSDDLDIDLLRNILETVQHVLAIGEQVATTTTGQRNKYADAVEECGGLDHIERLQQHKNTKVYELASQTLVRFFSDEVDHVDERDPHANNAAFEAQPIPQGGFYF